MALTEKQEEFCKQYLLDLNGKQAAIRAGYSAKTADVIAGQLLRKTSVKAQIDRLMAKRGQRVEVKADQVVRELCRIAFADIRKAVTWDASGVSVMPSDLIDEETGAAIAEVSQTQHGVRVKMHSKTEALAKLAQHLGMLIDRKEHTGKISLEVAEEIVDANDSSKEADDNPATSGPS